MQVSFSSEELRPVIEAVFAEMLERFEGDWLAKPEAEAAESCGVAKHVLRDARLRGEVAHGKIGAKIVYTKRQLLDFLEGQ